MKEGFFNKVLDKAEERMERVSDRVTKEFKNTLPFDTEEISRTQMLQNYEMLNTKPDMIMHFVEKYGIETVKGFVQEMEDEKLRRSYDKRTTEGKFYAER